MTNATPATPVKNIICMKWGTRYGPEYANKLYESVKAHITPPFRFVCITDDPTGLHKGIETKEMAKLELPTHLHNKPWLKLLVWEKPLYDIEGDALFLDVDVVITSSLDDFFTYKPGAFCVIHNWTEPTKKTGNTSVFRFPVGQHKYILNDFKADMAGVYAAHKIEQRYISKTIKTPQEFWPAAWCQSFKVNILPKWPQRLWKMAEKPADAKIIVFHGKPDPDEAKRGEWPSTWHKKWYKTLRPVTWIE